MLPLVQAHHPKQHRNFAKAGLWEVISIKLKGVLWVVQLTKIQFPSVPCCFVVSQPDG